VDDRLAEVEGYQGSGEIVAVEALDHRVVPVDLALRGLDLIDEALRIGSRRVEFRGFVLVHLLQARSLGRAGNLVRIQASRRLGLRLQAADRVADGRVELALRPAPLIEILDAEPRAGRGLLVEDASHVAVLAHSLVAP